MTATIAAILPFGCFQDAGATAAGYISIILVNAKHGLDMGILIYNLLFALLLLAPICFTWYIRRPTLGAFDLWFLGGLFVSSAMMTIIASKPGAGAHHFLPFVPIAGYGLLCILKAPTPRPSQEQLNIRDMATMVLASVLISYGHGELEYTKNTASRFATLYTEERKIDELLAFQRQFPLAEVGVSDAKHYSDTFYRPLLIFQGAPLHIDFGSWMDFAYAGVPETRIIGVLNRCDIPVWIVPPGATFTMTSPYTRLPLLSNEFRRTFFANYELIQKGEFYHVWRCRDRL